MHLKHARCGDLAMLLPVGRELLRWSGEALGHLGRGRRPSRLRRRPGWSAGSRRASTATWTAGAGCTAPGHAAA